MQRVAPDIAQQLARRFTTIHNVSYYAPEINRLAEGRFAEAGMRGWWMAYFGYRAAPLGRASVELVTSTFYNFAPRMVARAVPAVWDVLSPAEALAVRLEAVDEAFRRVFGDDVDHADLQRAATLARRAIDGVDVGARPLYAAHVALPWPEASASPRPSAALTLWHATTLLREHRGDSHNLALAAAEVDGIECHVLMAGIGHGNRATILSIRGWNIEEWDAAVRRLAARGWAHDDGSLTDAGRAARRAIEEHTNRLSLEPWRRIGPDDSDELVTLLSPIVEVLHGRGGIPGTWPPPHVRQPD